jgi:hypothetical protein
MFLIFDHYYLDTANLDNLQNQTQVTGYTVLFFYMFFIFNHYYLDATNLDNLQNQTQVTGTARLDQREQKSNGETGPEQ